MIERITPDAKKVNSPMFSTSTLESDDQGEFTIFQWDPLWEDSSTFPESTLRLCPYCGKLVLNEDNFFICRSETGRYYSCHGHCVDDTQRFIEFPEIGLKGDSDIDLDQVVTGVGAAEYLVTCRIEHPLTFFKYFQGTMKAYKGQNKIISNLNKKEANMYEPNAVVLPLREFKISLKLKNINNGEELSPLYLKACLGNQGFQNVSIIAHHTEYKFSGSFNIITDQNQKGKVVDQLNFKYPHHLHHQEMIIFNGFEIDFRHEPLESDHNQMEKCSLVDDGHDVVFPREKQGPSNNEVLNVFTTGDQCGEEELERVELVKKLKTQNGSKEFQNNVKNYKPQQLSQILEKILPHTEEIILDEYGNYMFQSLLRSCNYPQRLAIIQRVKFKIPQLVCKKQGTFVFQLFISLLTTPNEFEEIAEFLIPNLKFLVEDENGNHFMRKFIQLMPKSMLLEFTSLSVQSLVEFGTHKNGVCVMKSLLRALSRAENNQADCETSNLILSMIIQCTFELINNEFGNYLIQEAYERFGAERLFYLNQIVYLNVYRFSLEKISSNVVIQCLKKYWVGYPELYACVENSLESDQIRQLYKHKESNTMLLQMAQLSPVHSLKEKIIISVCDQPLSKFWKSRWSRLLEKAQSPSRVHKPKKKYYK